ncbi:energy transducer TonB [Paucidesulfovibrio longus]|uniref:energy transducer TonB n=1 Tax=Paucidesulfovibrio longus TaxID=889 RepID=UPI0003B3F0C3|nr:energy transducer TonB [Paucidesulfovibrio longus]
MARAFGRCCRALLALLGGIGITALLLLAVPLPGMRQPVAVPEPIGARTLYWDASMERSVQAAFPSAPPETPQQPEPITPAKPEPVPQPEPAPAMPDPSLSALRLSERPEPKRSDSVEAEPAPAHEESADEASRSAHGDASANTASGETAFELGEVDSAPGVRHGPAPEYPREARRKGVTGTVLLRFLVERDGSVSRIQVLQADPPGVFEENAIRAVALWRFRPGLRHGEPVRTWVRLPLRFRLER